MSGSWWTKPSKIMALSQAALPPGNVRDSVNPTLVGLRHGAHQPVVSNNVCAATNEAMHRSPPGDSPTVSELAITEAPAPR